MIVIFTWRKIGNELHGFTKVGDRTTQIFTIVKKASQFARPKPWLLHRMASGAIEDFKTQRAAKQWAESCLSNDVVVGGRRISADVTRLLK